MNVTFVSKENSEETPAQLTALSLNVSDSEIRRKQTLFAFIAIEDDNSR